MPTTEMLNALLNTRREFPEPPFPMEPRPNRRESNAVVYVSGFAPDTEASDEVRARIVHTVQRTTGHSFSGVYWMVRDPETDLAWRCTGYPLDAQPVNGMHYRTLDHGILIRYNDDDHMDQRHQPGQPYSILASADGPWPLPDDALYPDPVNDYPPMVRVIYEGDGVLDDQQPEPEHVTDLPRTELIRDLVLMESDDRALKNPDPVIGEMYLMWDSSDDTPAINVVSYHGRNESGDEPLFAPLAFFDSGPEPRLHSSSSMYIRTENMVWVKARLAEPSPTEEQLSASAATVPVLRTELNTELEKWDSFGEALNEIAEEHGWCEQFDQIVRDLGFEGRAKDWWVTVEADLTIEDNNPSSRMDDRLESEYGVTISASSVEVRGKVTVTINNITAANADEAQNSIDSSNVESALDNYISGCSYTLHDWEVDDSGQED